MMRINLLLLMFFFAFSVISIYAQEKEEEIPPGMEIKRVGKLDLMLPKDMKVTQKGSVWVVETTQQYIARRFMEMEEQIARLKEEQEALKEEIEELKKNIDELQKGGFFPQEETEPEEISK
jgi:peptidoglycan hydrolase CwlO-like protein